MNECNEMNDERCKEMKKMMGDKFKCCRVSLKGVLGLLLARTRDSQKFYNPHRVKIQPVSRYTKLPPSSDLTVRSFADIAKPDADAKVTKQSPRILYRA